MKDLKRKLAVLLTLCLVLTGAVPAYGEEMTVPVKTAEMSELFAESAETIVPEAVCAEAVEAEAVEAEPAEDEAFVEDPAVSTEKPEQAAAMLGAADPVTYFDWDDAKKKLVEKNCTEYTVIGSTTAEPEGGYTLESGKWYVVKDTVTFNKRIENKAAKDTPARLILTDGCVFNVPKGIQNEDGKGLCIYGQAQQSGKLNITGPDDRYAGIGGCADKSGGSVIINGGTVTANGGGASAGIGGGYYGNGGSITINGGTVTAAGGYDENQGSSGIGGGFHNSGESIITINGGTVTANGTKWAAGIGGGEMGPGGKTTINGGTVTANGGTNGAGIGGGEMGSGGTITITGGNITARGGSYASGIGSGYKGDLGNVIINGGTLNAYGGDNGGKGINGNKEIKPELLIYAGDSKESAKRSDPEGAGARFVFISGDCAEVKYTVSHQQQKTDAGGYVEKEKETLYGGEGWKTEAAAKSYAGFTAQGFSQQTIASDGSTVVTIKYNRNTYTITFDTNGRAAAPEPLKAVFEAEIKAPQAPEAEGYQLEGWYKEKECTNPYTFSTMPAENLTLYAKWEVDPSKRQKISYADEDGSTKEASCIILSKDKDFYAFDTDEWYALRGNITINNRMENGASKDSPAHLILTDGASLTVKGGIHNPDGKGLVIYSQEKGTGMLSVSDTGQANAGIGGANRQKGGMTIINGGLITAAGGRYGAGIGGGQDGDGGEITINGGTVSITGGYEGAGIGGGLNGNGGAITINGGTITAAGGEFGSGIGAGRHKSEGTLVFGSDPGVLRAGENKDDASDVDVDTYKKNHQAYGFVMISYATASYTVEHWKQITIRTDDYQFDVSGVHTGFVDTYAEVVSKEYPGYGDPKYTPEKIKEDGTTRIVAKYDLIYSTITFDANGHGTAPEPICAVPGAEITAPKEPSEEGYTFEGWYTEAKCTNQYKFSTMPPEDKKLYAKWTPVQYTITWKDGNTVLRTDKVDYDAMPSYGPDPVKQGYEFVSWWPTVQKVTGDATYNAIFFKPSVKYTVTWMLNDIKLIDTTEVTEGEMPVHENPAMEGYIFIGWQPALAPVTGNAKYTAYFEKRAEDKVAVTFNTDGGTFINTQVIDRNTAPVKPSDPQKKGCEFEGWYREAGFVTPYEFTEPLNTDITLYAKWKTVVRIHTITWKDWDGKTLATVKVEEGGLPKYPGASKPSRSGYNFTGWTPEIDLAYADMTYKATYAPQTVINGGGGGGGGAPAVKKTAVTFSQNWYADGFGVWRIKNSAGQVVTNAWLCDDAVTANGQNVWYLLTQDGAMLAAGLVQDNTGNFYSLETNHDGYFGMLRYTDGYYNCNGQQVYLKFSKNHDGTFGAITNTEGLEKLKAIYGVTKCGIGNENAVYTKTF